MSTDDPSALRERLAADRPMRNLRKRIAQRDRRISGLEKKIAMLERALATRSVETESVFQRNVERAVQHALCNVRMIPVRGIGTDPQILEVRAFSGKPAGNK